MRPRGGGMIYELVEIHVVPGQEEDFHRRRSRRRSRCSLPPKGCHGLALKRSIEVPDLFPPAA